MFIRPCFCSFGDLDCIWTLALTLEDCAGDEDCPDGSACIRDEDDTNYCFRVCDDKPECNRNRSAENESNCSANVDFVDDRDGRKACVPPSSGL